MKIEYIINNEFSIYPGFECNSSHILNAANHTNDNLSKLPFSLYRSIDLKTSSAIIGAIFSENIAKQTGAIVNPIEKGHPDIIPKDGKNSTEKMLRNYPRGIEIKVTVGNVIKGSELKTGDSRINHLNGITWQAHHREVRELLGIIWDFNSSPIISAIFYSNDLSFDDWGKISGTTGRNTKVTGMCVTGKKKMGRGWIIIFNDYDYISRYRKLLAREIGR